jgi:predicted transcriptional regulator
VQLALAEYLRRRPFELEERFLREDIAWALGQTGEEETPTGPSGERDRFLEAVEEGLADAKAGRVISDEELGRCLDKELGPLDTGHLKKRLRKDRPMTTIALRMQEDIVQDLERLAQRLGLSGNPGVCSLGRRGRQFCVQEVANRGTVEAGQLASLD